MSDTITTSLGLHNLHICLASRRGFSPKSLKKIRRLSDDLDSWEKLLDDPDAMVVTMLDPSGRPLGRSISERRQLRHKLKGLITLEMLGDTTDVSKMSRSLGILLGKPMWHQKFPKRESHFFGDGKQIYEFRSKQGKQLGREIPI